MAAEHGPLVVVGDALLDVDLEGRAGRLAPDAPVPVLDELVEHARPGGAGLAAALAARDGVEVVLITATADDEAGERLAGLLAAAGVRLVAVPRAGSTVVKRRVRSAGQSLLRLDEGQVDALTVDPTDLARAALDEAVAVLVADYGHGLLADPALRERLAVVAGRVPLVWDPHPRGSAPAPGARLVTPNEREALAAAPAGAAGRSRLAAADAAARRLVEAWRAHAVAVTLGERGALLTHGAGAPSLFPAPRVRATDVCGAGDRFAASASVALGRGALVPEAVQSAVAAAAAYVGQGGAASALADPGAEATTSAETVRAAGGTVVATGGCFDLLHAGHVATLEAARALGDHLVVCVNSDASVRRLKGSSRPVVAQGDRVRVLQALACVDEVVVFDEDTPRQVLGRLRPDLWVKGGDYAGAALPESAQLATWGGQAVVVPYLEGRSTTGLVASVTGVPVMGR